MERRHRTRAGHRQLRGQGEHHCAPHEPRGQAFQDVPRRAGIEPSETRQNYEHRRRDGTEKRGRTQQKAQAGGTEADDVFGVAQPGVEPGEVLLHH
ncbi:hypothetical protein GCM10009674_05700 [Nesterenkonia xinjiangensis]